MYVYIGRVGAPHRLESMYDIFTYKKPSAENYLLPFSSSALAAPKQKKRPPLRRMVIGAPLSDLITIEAANIWEW